MKTNEVKNNNKLRNYFIAIVYMLVSLTLVTAASIGGFFSTQHFLRALESVHWPSANGVITRSWIEERRSADPGKRTTYTYAPRVEYVFPLNGKRFKGHTMDFISVSNSDWTDADSILKIYPVGQTIPVYYLPDDPSVNVLNPGLDSSAWILCVVGGAFASVGFIMLFKARQFIKEIQDAIA